MLHTGIILLRYLFLPRYLDHPRDSVLPKSWGQAIIWDSMKGRLRSHSGGGSGPLIEEREDGELGSGVYMSGDQVWGSGVGIRCGAEHDADLIHHLGKEVQSMEILNNKIEYRSLSQT